MRKQDVNNHRRTLRGLALVISVVAIVALLAVWAAREARDLYSEVRLTTHLSVGMAAEDVTDLLGRPDAVIQEPAAFAADPFSQFQTPQRPIEECVLAYRLRDKAVYVFIGKDDLVTCVFWASQDSSSR